jgi:hypothetical protein
MSIYQESHAWAAVLSMGAKVLEQLLQEIGSGQEPRAIVGECGARMESRGLITTRW